MRHVLRLGILISNISRLGGGVSEAVIKLAVALKSTDSVEPVIFAAEDPAVAEARARLADIELHTRPPMGPNIFKYMPGLLRDMLAARVDLMHLHGIWQYPSILGTLWQRRARRPYIVSPHGMLEDWILKKGVAQKTLAGIVYERRSLANATIRHALTASEADQIRRYVPGASVVIIPNGVDRVPADPPAERSRRPYMLYLGRLDKKKNILALIEAWRRLDCDGSSDHRLMIAGWGDAAYVKEIESAVAVLSGAVEFIGPIYGAQKQKILGGARYLVLPSLSEGLPMAVLEAWACGVPVIMTKACNLAEGFSYNAAIECDISPESILAGLKTAIAMNETNWSIMSRQARQIVADRYDTGIVTGQWLDQYQQLTTSNNSSVHG